MSRVADKVGMARATRRQRSSAVKRAASSANVAVARACVHLHWPIPCGVPRPTLRRCVRRAPKSRGHSPWRGAQRRERTILSQPFRDKADATACRCASLIGHSTRRQLSCRQRAACFVRLLTKEMARETLRQRSSAVKRAVSSANVTVREPVFACTGRSPSGPLGLRSGAALDSSSFAHSIPQSRRRGHVGLN